MYVYYVCIVVVVVFSLFQTFFFDDNMRWCSWNGFKIFMAVGGFSSYFRFRFTEDILRQLFFFQLVFLAFSFINVTCTSVWLEARVRRGRDYSWGNKREESREVHNLLIVGSWSRKVHITIFLKPLLFSACHYFFLFANFWCYFFIKKFSNAGSMKFQFTY